MPLSARDRKLFLCAGLVFLLLVGVALLFGSGEHAGEEYPSSYSTASGGAKAAYLLLADSGYKVQRWERPLSDLPLSDKAPKAKTLILAEPFEAPTQEERERLRDFISEGGHVIATGMFVGTFLPENDSVPEVLPSRTWKKATSLSPSRVTRAAPQIEIAPRAYWRSGSAAYPLYAEGDRAVVVKYPFGKGEVQWWAAATPLTNAGLKETGNLEFFLACLGDQKNEILWDEYIHGYRETLAASLAHSTAKWLLLQLVLLAAAVVATFSRRSGPTAVPASDVRLSPLEFVYTLGGLYQRAGTASVAVEICYRRFRFWLAKRLGMAGNTSAEDLARAIRGRWGVDDAHFIAIMKQCESAGSDPFLPGPVALHLVQELDEYAERWNLYQGVRKEKD
jgi:hypothetical protein